MKTQQNHWSRVVGLTCLMAGIALGSASVCPSKAWAFDTGHHSDLTRSVLQEEGFGDTAIKAAQLQNWLVDYYSSTPTAHLDANLKSLEELHFDNLYSASQIHSYWGHFAFNAHGAIQDAARQNDVLKALTLLGASMHAVQDFYTHSNWVETHPRQGDSFRTDTYFSNPPGNTDLYTGFYPNEKPGNNGRQPHGDYTSGMNHDSYVRPRFDEAYVFAYVASRQWVEAMHDWAEAANPGFWAKVQAFTVSGQDAAELGRDLNAAYRISEWVATPGQNGHWKGSGSGSLAEFGGFTVSWMAQHNSIFVEQFKTQHNFLPLVAGLVGNDELRQGQAIAAAGALPPVPAPHFDDRVVIVRTTKIEELPVGFFETKIDVGGKADFYGKIAVGGQTFIEAMQNDQSSVAPQWTTMRFVSGGAGVPIHYELWDEDGGLAGDDDHCDINPAGGQSDLNFQFDPNAHNLTGDVSGVHDGNGNAATSGGAKPDKDRASLSFFVTTRGLQ